MISARAVILAAGTSSRMPKQKLLMEFRGRTLIEYPITAAHAWNPLVVCSAEVEQYLLNRPGIELLRNDEPERGMSHSLALANRIVAADLMLLVLLGDKPLVSRSLIESTCVAAQNADVTYPVHGGVPGHPVAFSPRARRYIDDAARRRYGAAPARPPGAYAARNANFRSRCELRRRHR